MGEVIKVGMADLNICKAPDTITTLGRDLKIPYYYGWRHFFTFLRDLIRH